MFQSEDESGDGVLSCTVMVLVLAFLLATAAFASFGTLRSLERLRDAKVTPSASTPQPTPQPAATATLQPAATATLAPNETIEPNFDPWRVSLGAGRRAVLSRPDAVGESADAPGMSRSLEAPMSEAEVVSTPVMDNTCFEPGKDCVGYNQWVLGWCEYQVHNGTGRTRPGQSALDCWHELLPHVSQVYVPSNAVSAPADPHDGPPNPEPPPPPEARACTHFVFVEYHAGTDNQGNPVSQSYTIRIVSATRPPDPPLPSDVDDESNGWDISYESPSGCSGG